MAMTVLEGEPPLILNFENPEDMFRKQELLATEIARREAAKSGLPGVAPGATPPAAAPGTNVPVTAAVPANPAAPAANGFFPPAAPANGAPAPATK
jgi:hypothetical protein